MSAEISIGSIRVGAASNCFGIFSGQNYQSNWDSHSPSISARAGIFANGNMAFTGTNYVSTQSLIGMPLMDQDIKSNQSPSVIGL